MNVDLIKTDPLSKESHNGPPITPLLGNVHPLYIITTSTNRIGRLLFRNELCGINGYSPNWQVTQNSVHRLTQRLKCKNIVSTYENKYLIELSIFSKVTNRNDTSFIKKMYYTQ